MKVVRMSVGTHWLQRVFYGHEYSRMTTDMPDDAEIVYANWDAEHSAVVLTVMSETFADVPAGHTVPEWSPTVTLHMDETAQLLNIVHKNMTEAID